MSAQKRDAENVKQKTQNRKIQNRAIQMRVSEEIKYLWGRIDMRRDRYEEIDIDMKPDR